jgi:hypothetical protein
VKSSCVAPDESTPRRGPNMRVCKPKGHVIRSFVWLRRPVAIQFRPVAGLHAPRYGCSCLFAPWSWCKNWRGAKIEIGGFRASIPWGFRRINPRPPRTRVYDAPHVPLSRAGRDASSAGRVSSISVLSRFSSFDAMKYRSSNTCSRRRGSTHPTAAAHGKVSNFATGGITAEGADMAAPSASRQASGSSQRYNAFAPLCAALMNCG